MNKRGVGSGPMLGNRLGSEINYFHIFAGENLDDMQWHTVQLDRNGKETGVILDGSKPKYLQNDGVGETLTLNSGLYVGGVPDEITEEKNGKVVFKNVKWARR